MEGWLCVFFQAEDGIRDLVRSRGLGDVYKRQKNGYSNLSAKMKTLLLKVIIPQNTECILCKELMACLLYTSDAADERSSVDLGGRRIIKKKNDIIIGCRCVRSTKWTLVVIDDTVYQGRRAGCKYCILR